jgi:hypothetical protein
MRVFEVGKSLFVVCITQIHTSKIFLDDYVQSPMFLKVHCGIDSDLVSVGPAYGWMR